MMRPLRERLFVPLAEETPPGLPPVRVCVWRVDGPS